MNGDTEKGESEEMLVRHVSERCIILLSKNLLCVFRLLGCGYNGESNSYRPTLKEIIALANHIEVDFFCSRNFIKF